MNAQPDSEKKTFLDVRTGGGTLDRSIDPSRQIGLGERVRGMPRKWLVGGVAALLIIAAIVWAVRSPAPPAATAGGTQQTLPLVSVMTPKSDMVKATVTFSGAIGARYDIPIGVEGEGGRITGVLVEAGDPVRRGQVLARLDQSTLVPQLNRLSAALDEARAQAALSLAEYGRAQGRGAVRRR